MKVAENRAKIQNLYWNDFLSVLKNAKSQNEQDILIKARCETDVEAFAIVFFPHYCGHNFNEFHDYCFEVFADRRRGLREATAAPRGSAKSTFKTLIKPIHDVCYGLEKFLVVISNTEDQSIAKLDDIRAELLQNVDLNRVYGPFFKSKRLAKTMFEIGLKKSEIRLEALGMEEEMRGLRFRNYRPTKIICDDLEHSTKVESEILREKSKKRFFEVITKLGDEKTNLEVVGTLLHRQSILADLLKNPMYRSKLFRSVRSFSKREDLWQQWREILLNLEDPKRREKAEQFYQTNKAQMLDGTDVLWPEKEPYVYLMAEKLEIGHSAWMKEKQNDPLAAMNNLFSNLQWYREVEDGFLIEKTNTVIKKQEILRSYGAMDPATGQTKPKAGYQGDYTSILSGLVTRSGRLLVHDAWLQRASPSEFINRIFDSHETFDYHRFAIETNLYRDLLMTDIRKKKKEIEKTSKKAIRLDFEEIENVRPKRERIYSLEPKVNNGQILFNRNLNQTFLNQLEEFPNAEHDDGPDSLEMLWKIVVGSFEPGALRLYAQRR